MVAISRQPLSISKGKDYAVSSGNPCQRFDTLTVKKCLLMFGGSLLRFVVLIASGLVTGHRWEEPDSILFAPFVFVDIKTTPLEPSLLWAEQSQLSP